MHKEELNFTTIERSQKIKNPFSAANSTYNGFLLDLMVLQFEKYIIYQQ